MLNKPKKRKFKFKSTIILFFSVLFVFGLTSPGVSAATRSYGVDNSVYQGSSGRFGASSDKFNISQIGGIYNSSVKWQSTYNTQVAYTIATGRRAHTYIFLADGANTARTQTYVAQMLAKIQTPKGSIVAIDYESGASGSVSGNTDNILTAMNMIKAAGYTPMFYSYKPYLVAHVDSARLLKAYPTSLWIASYKTTSIQTYADFNYFPSYDGVAIWQFADNYGVGNVDGNIDLTGITEKGYDGTTKSTQGGTAVVTNTTTPAIKAGQTANNTPKSDISKGYVVKVNYSATKWATGQRILSSVKGQSYTVAQVSGSKVLLGNVNSWINRKDVEILATSKELTASKAVTATYYTVKAGDTLSGIGLKYGISYSKIASLNGLSNANRIYIGQRLKVSGSSTSSKYVVKYGDTLGAIAKKYGTTASALASKNGIKNVNRIYVGETLNV